MTAFDHMTAAEYRAYLQNHASGPEESAANAEVPSAFHFGRMTAAEYQALLKADRQQPSGPNPVRQPTAKKKPAPLIPTESEEQRAVMDWAELASGKWLELRLLYHVPNEGRRSMATGGRMRAEGLKSGVPDLCLPVARAGYHGLYIEMKRTQGSKTSQEQKEWLEALAAEGYKTALCRGAEEAIEEMESYLMLPKKGDEAT